METWKLDPWEQKWWALGIWEMSILGTLKSGLGNAHVEAWEHGQLGNDDEGVHCC